MRILTALLLAGTTLFAVGPQTAQAADLPLKAPRAVPGIAPAWSWTGFYIGAHVGGAWGTIESEFASGNVNGFLGGGQIGYNFQNGPVVFGIEADASWTGVEGKTTCLIVGSCEREMKALGTITGRLGFTADRALIYVKGGGAWASVEHDAKFFGESVASADDTYWGWTVGTGVEYAITPNWSAKIEYNYMDFGNNTLAFSTPAGALDVETTTAIHAVKFGVNYRFGGDPIGQY